MAGQDSFRVIIVGAGPAGLYLASALSRANIDFVVLERYHTILTHAGAGTAIWSYSTRLLAQLGLLDRLERDVARVETLVQVLRSGRVLRRTDTFKAMEDRFNYPVLATSRAELIRVLYESIPGREERVRANAHVVDIETGDDGVRVHLEDGTVEEGAVVVGADGAHSATRHIMQRLSGEAPTAMTTTFRGIFGKAHGMPGYSEGLFYEMRGPNMACQSFGAGGWVHFAFLWKAGEPFTEHRTYSEKEMMQFAEQVPDMHPAPGVTFRELWAHTDKSHARLVNMEEGIVEGPWHHQRIVLLGDAVHKLTTITGQGVNAGMHSAAALANELRRAVRADSSPDTAQIEDAFARYERSRRSTAATLCEVSERVTRLVSWSSWFLWLFDRFLVGWMSQRPLLDRLAGLMARGQVLDYVPFADPESEVPWVNTAPADE